MCVLEINFKFNVNCRVCKQQENFRVSQGLLAHLNADITTAVTQTNMQTLMYTIRNASKQASKHAVVIMCCDQVEKCSARRNVSADTSRIKLQIRTTQSQTLACNVEFTPKRFCSKSVDLNQNLFPTGTYSAVAA